jgi:hypothetical protein
MGNGYVLRRALLGLLAATLGGVAASAGAVHLRSQLTDTAQATTFSCGRGSAHGSSRLQRAPAAQSGNHAVCRTTKPHTVRASNSASANQPPVVAVLVPVQRRSKTYPITAVNGRTRRNGIFVDGGSVSYGSVTYCSPTCRSDSTKSQGPIVPVTVVDVRYTGAKKKTATKK